MSDSKDFVDGIKETITESIASGETAPDEIDTRLTMLLDRYLNSINESIQALTDNQNRAVQILNTLTTWATNVEEVLQNHNIRMNVVETLISHPDFQKEREAFVKGELSMDDIAQIIKTYVIPMLRKQAEESKTIKNTETNDAPPQDKDNVVKFPGNKQTVIRNEDQ